MFTKGTMTLAFLPLYGVFAAPVDGPGTTVAAGTSDRDVVRAIHSGMDDQYGASHYNAKYGCWDIEVKGEGARSTQYCMTPGKPYVVTENGQASLYFLAYNRSDITGDADYSYSQSHLGLMGAFKAIRDAKAGKWTFVAVDKAMDYGAGGACGCADADFLSLGTTRHGWIFTSGGNWQGALVLNYAIVTDFDGKFYDVSSIPRVREDAQDIKYELRVTDSRQAQPMFPLVVTKTKDGKAIDEISVPFDPAKRVYALPKGE